MALVKCVDCGAEVSTAAMACPKCGAPSVGAVPTQAAPGEGFGYLILLLPLGATVLIWLWVGSMNLFQDPATSLTMIGFATILCTAVLIAVEASQLGMGKLPAEKGKVGSSPIAWFFASVLFWLVAFPFYLSKRRWYGKRSLAVGGVLVALVFVGSWGVMSASIETKKTEIRQRLQGLGMP